MDRGTFQAGWGQARKRLSAASGAYYFRSPITTRPTKNGDTWSKVESMPGHHRNDKWDFLGGSVAKTPSCQYRVLMFHTRSEN